MCEKKPAYKRVLLKLSGEALAKKETHNIDGVEKTETVSIFDEAKIAEIAAAVRDCIRDGVQVAVVIGAGNIWRGKLGEGVDRARADHMGMLATTINCLRFADALEKLGLRAHVMTPVSMDAFAEPFQYRRAIEYLEAGEPVVFACGIGIPFVSTDTATVVRAAEIHADVILMAKNIDGIYSADPRKHADAVKFRKVSYAYCLENKLVATDVSASALAEEQGIDSYVFSLADPANIGKAVHGEQIGTLVTTNDTEPEIF